MQSHKGPAGGADTITTLSNDNARLKHEIDVLNAKMASKMADHWMWKDMTKLKNETGLQIERLQAELKESNSLVALNRAGVEKRKREAKEAEEKLAMFEFYKTEYLRLKMQIENKTEVWKLFNFTLEIFSASIFFQVQEASAKMRRAATAMGGAVQRETVRADDASRELDSVRSELARLEDYKVRVVAAFYQIQDEYRHHLGYLPRTRLPEPDDDLADSSM